MAYDKVIDSAWLEAGLKKVCDAIRGKTGGADGLAFPDGMESAVASIVAGDDTVAKVKIVGRVVNTYTHYVVIGGVTYTAAAEIEVPVGTSLTAYTQQNTSAAGGVWLNGERVTSISGTVGSVSYTHVITGDTAVDMGDIGGSSPVDCVRFVRITTL